MNQIEQSLEELSERILAQAGDCLKKWKKVFSPLLPDFDILKVTRNNDGIYVEVQEKTTGEKYSFALELSYVKEDDLTKV